MSTAEEILAQRGPMTRAEAHRVLVSTFDAEGVPLDEIARRVGITVDRVEQILDQLDGVPHDGVDPAPGIEPVKGPAVVRSTTPVPVRSPQSPPAPAAPRRRGRTATHGTYAGYNKHAASKGGPDDWPRKPCEPCQEARREYQRNRHASRREIHEGTPEEIRPYRKGDEIECGTVQGYDRHKRNDEAPCRECKDAWNDYRRQLRATITGPAKAPARPRVQIRWLVPRGEHLPAGARIEFGLLSAGEIRPATEGAAEIAANNGAPVYRRTVTDWLEVTE